MRRGALPADPIAGAAQLNGGGVTLVLGGYTVGERFVAVPALSSALAFGYLVVFGSIIGFSAALRLRGISTQYCFAKLEV